MRSEIADGLKRWKDFSGRSSRAQFWWFSGFFLALPLILQIPLWVVVFVFAPGPGALLPFLILSFAWVILIPAQISNNARRLHDVGKSGWLMLLPLYNLYLYVQPPHEQGKMPSWYVAEKVALVFIFLPLFGLLEGDVTTSIGGSITWLAIYLTIRWYNGKEKRKLLETP